MTKLNFVHLCDNAFLSAEGKLNLIGIFKNISVVKFPASHPTMTVVVNITVDKEIALKIRLQKKKAKEPISTIETKLTPPEKDNIEIGFIANFNNIKFEESGEYEVEILIDNKPLEENVVPFTVQKVQK